MLRIDLCCGHNCREGCEGLDVEKWNNRVKYVVDLNKDKLPFEDSSVDEFYEQNSFYELDNPMKVIEECHRCLKVGGSLEVQEMYFASHYAFTPLTKNFWSFSSLRLFEKGYRYEGKWRIDYIDFVSNTFPPRWLVNLNRNFYEKYLSRIMPLTYIRFRLVKL